MKDETKLQTVTDRYYGFPRFPLSRGIIELCQSSDKSTSLAVQNEIARRNGRTEEKRGRGGGEKKKEKRDGFPFRTRDGVTTIPEVSVDDCLAGSYYTRVTNGLQRRVSRRLNLNRIVARSSTLIREKFFSFFLILIAERCVAHLSTN